VPAAGLLSRAAIAAAFMLLAAASCASAGQRPMDRAPYATDATTKGSSPAVAALLGDSSFSGDAHQHGGTGGHLPASRANVALVGKLTPTSPFGAIVPGQIADIAVYKDYAYLSSWSESTCTKGGVYVADIRNLRKPKQLGFIPALPGNFHGEGAQAISVATKAFSGNLLVSNNEFCTDTPTVGGGFDLYDVTDPAHPHVLVQGAGDRGGEGRLNGSSATARQYHSTFLWKADGKVYLVASDDDEVHDVADVGRLGGIRHVDQHVARVPVGVEQHLASGDLLDDHGGPPALRGRLAAEPVLAQRPTPNGMRARTRWPPAMRTSIGTQPGRLRMKPPGKPVVILMNCSAVLKRLQSVPISATSPSAVSVSIPRRHRSRATSSAHEPSAAARSSSRSSCSMRRSMRSSACR
jgi:hypothetical protein